MKRTEIRQFLHLALRDMREDYEVMEIIKVSQIHNLAITSQSAASKHHFTPAGCRIAPAPVKPARHG
jgi:hypothetical protein